MSPPVVVIGFGGHGRVVASALLAAGRHVVAAVDPCFAGSRCDGFGFEVIDDGDLPVRFPPESVELALGIGSIGPAEAGCRRRTVAVNLQDAGYTFTSLRHPFSWVSPDAVLGQGAQVHAGAVIQPGVRIGAFSIINTRASVDHDCDIGDYCHLAPGTTLSGNVRVGAGSHLGTASCVIQGLSIGSGCLIAAGATVVHDVADGVAVRGVPARRF